MHARAHPGHVSLRPLLPIFPERTTHAYVAKEVVAVPGRARAAACLIHALITRQILCADAASWNRRGADHYLSLRAGGRIQTASGQRDGRAREFVILVKDQQVTRKRA